MLPRILALMLLTVWLPATLHCRLEGAGLLEETCAGDCGHESSSPNDGCDLVENAFYKSTSVPLKIAAPALLSCFFLVPVELHAVAPSPPEPASDAEPQVLKRTWQFVQRAAPPCRAPSRFA